MKRLFVLLVLIAHVIYSLIIIQSEGFFSLFPPFPNPYANQIFLDLAISLNIGLYLFYRHIKTKGDPIWPIPLCAIGIILFGSVAPLIFLLTYKSKDGERLV